jgi:hypothetical protein
VAKSGFKLDRTFAARVLSSPGIRDVLEPKAEKVAERARQLAPDDPATTSDDLRSSIRVVLMLRAGGWIARVVATDYKAHWKEFGSSREPAKPYLRPAVEAEVGPLNAGGE